MAVSGLWSVNKVKSLPKRNWWNFLILKINESTSFSICTYICSQADRVRKAKATGCSNPSKSTWEITAPTPYGEALQPTGLED